jgi:copper homeostasis protein
MLFSLEICCFNFQSAIVARDAGAHRIELCQDAASGGTTPSFGVIKATREKLDIPVYPIIRPRGGDFLFSSDEFESMLRDVALCKQLGCDGVVIGILKSDGSVDRKRCAKLVELAYPMGVTFHRAFDWSANPFESLEEIIQMGCERVLTSGQRQLASDGGQLIQELIRQADGRISVMPGSGIRASNIIDLARQTGAEEFHSSARILQSSTMAFSHAAMQEDQSLLVASSQEIAAMLEALQAYALVASTHD